MSTLEFDINDGDHLPDISLMIIMSAKKYTYTGLCSRLMVSRKTIGRWQAGDYRLPLTNNQKRFIDWAVSELEPSQLERCQVPREWMA